MFFIILHCITGKAKDLFTEKESHPIIEKEEITLSNMVASSNDHFVLSAWREDGILYGADVYNAFSKKEERIYACKKEDLEKKVEEAYKRYGRGAK